MFVSKYLRTEGKLEELGVFDSLINEDSNFFINIKLLKECRIPEFSKSYEKINTYFKQIGVLLSMSASENDKTYRTAYKMFDFSEVNGINLGFAESTHGAGFGKKLRKKIIKDAMEIIKKGGNYPEIFQLVSLFEENVGPDRLSDMIATIIYGDIVEYTLRIMKELNITPEQRCDLEFVDGLVKNPYKNCEILLLPISILHELPIAKDWDDIERVARENEAVKKEINEVVREQWKELSSEERKNYLKDQVFMVPHKCKRIVEAYSSSEIPAYDIYQNYIYNSTRIFEKDICKKMSFAQKKEFESIDSYSASKEMLNMFQEWIEYNDGSSIIRNADSHSREKVCQRLVHLCAKYYMTENNLDFSCETNAGRGPADFKISRGNDKTVIEVKLSSNNQYLHGLTTQIEEYAKAENAKHKIYVFIDIGNPIRLKTIQNTYRQMVNNGDEPAELYVIDANVKESASKY